MLMQFMEDLKIYLSYACIPRFVPFSSFAPVARADLPLDYNLLGYTKSLDRQICVCQQTFSMLSLTPNSLKGRRLLQGLSACFAIWIPS